MNAAAFVERGDDRNQSFCECLPRETVAGLDVGPSIFHPSLRLLENVSHLNRLIVSTAKQSAALHRNQGRRGP